jgi:hypothetical protein
MLDSVYVEAFPSEGFNIERRGRSGLARDWRRRNRRRRLSRRTDKGLQSRLPVL